MGQNEQSVRRIIGRAGYGDVGQSSRYRAGRLDAKMREAVNQRDRSVPVLQGGHSAGARFPKTFGERGLTTATLQARSDRGQRRRFFTRLRLQPDFRKIVQLSPERADYDEPGVLAHHGVLDA